MTNIQKNEQQKQFQFIVNGRKAFIDFAERANVTYLLYAEVPVELRGQGIGEIMVEKVLAMLKAENKKVIPRCGFIGSYIRRHPQWVPMLAQE